MSLGVDELDVHAKTVFDSFCNSCFLMLRDVFVKKMRVSSPTISAACRFYRMILGVIELDLHTWTSHTSGYITLHHSIYIIKYIDI